MPNPLMISLDLNVNQSINESWSQAKPKCSYFFRQVCLHLCTATEVGPPSKRTIDKSHINELRKKIIGSLRIFIIEKQRQFERYRFVRTCFLHPQGGQLDSSAFLKTEAAYYVESSKQLCYPISYKVQWRHAVVKALRYKSEGRGFDSRWYHWNFPLT